MMKNPEAIADWRECWGGVLAGIDLMRIKDALDQCAQKFAWPPSTAEFLNLCNPPAPEINYEQLFIDAANGKRADPLVYWSAYSFGNFDLQRMKYQDAKQRWISIVNQFALNGPIPQIPESKPPLPSPGKTMSREAAESGLNDIKSLFNGGDYRAWAKNPKSQAAVDLMFSDPPMTEEIEIATQAGAIIGKRWIAQHKRVPLIDRCEAGRKVSGD